MVTPAEAIGAAALILIDVQQAFDNPSLGRRNNPDAERQISRLLTAWRASGGPIYHVKHNSRDPQSLLHPRSAGNAIKPVARPLEREPLIEKQVNSAFIGTTLEQQLRDAEIESIVIVGFTTNHCVETTIRMAGNLGFDTYLVADATATFDRRGPDGKLHRAEEIHAISLANLHDEFATIMTTDAILDAVSAASGHNEGHPFNTPPTPPD